jgi:translocation and assembly module TamA
LICRIFSCFLLLLVTAVHSGFAGDVLEVTVTGVTGKLHENIMSGLRINLLRQNIDLNESEILRLHRLAPQDITSTLAAYGFHLPTVDATLTPVGIGWRAAYHVRPGKQVYITDISVTITGEGSTVDALRQPLQEIALKKGTPLNHPLYEQEKRRLLRDVRSRGYLQAAYTVQEIRIDRLKQSAEIELVLDTGPLHRFGEIVSEQNVIEEDLFYRFVPFKKGDEFDPALLHQLQRDLYRTGFFSQVSVNPRIHDQDAPFIPIIMSAQPLPGASTTAIGLGYATDTGANISVNYHNRLLNRKAHSAFSSLMLGSQASSFHVNYRVPGADPRFASITGSGSYNRELWQDTETQRLAAGAVYEFQKPTSSRAISILGFGEEYSIGSNSARGQFFMPGLHGSQTITDNAVNTTNGFRASFDLEGAHSDWFSDASFVKLRLNGQGIVSPFENWRLIGRGSIGSILVDSIDDLPPSLRFYAGGEKSVRGYKYKTLGPEDSSGNIVGGRYLLTGSIAWERQIADLWRVSAFYDIGNAMDNWSKDLVQGIGVGVGLVLPFGHATLELAYPLDDQGTAQYLFIRVGTDL